MSASSDGPEMPERLFSPDEADALVPHLEAAFATISHHRGQLTAFVKELESLDVDLGEDIPPERLAQPEIHALVTRALEERSLIRGELAQLEALGVEVKALDGLVDFRALLEGRTVYLCWRWGEARITHWHELDTGFAGRRPIKASDAFERSWAS